MKRIERFEPKITDIKILVTVSHLNELGLYPLVEGVLKVLKGEVGEETIGLVDCPTFQTLLSYSSKQLSRRVMMLLRYDYLCKKYDRETNELYLSISEKGKGFLLTYYKKRKMHFVKKKVSKTPTIVKII